MFSQKKTDFKSKVKNQLNNSLNNGILIKNKVVRLDFKDININYNLIYISLILLFFLSPELFDLFTYYFIILYPGYITMNLVICNKFSLEDYCIENKECKENIVIDKNLTQNKIVKYNHILCYWLLFSIFFFIENFIFIFKFIIPLYPIFKIILVVWYLCGGNLERKNNLFYNLGITPIYQYILNINKELIINKIN